MLRSFTEADRREMIADDGMITVTCEFCSARYRVAPEEIALEESQVEAKT
jgi:molecular chaperone Hsp33